MKNRLLGLAAFSLALTAFLLAVVPARAQNIDEKIKALEQEITQLKDQQMELKKEATAAAAALPTFSYRPGNGVTIEAADKAWSIRFAHEGHLRMMFSAGRDEAGRTNGEVMGRRFRPEFYYCVDNCFFENVTRIDLDGFGTSTTFNIQRAIFQAHFEQMNPYLPTFRIGFRGPSVINGTRQGSGNYGAQEEYDLLSRNNGWNTGAWDQGFGVFWDRVPLGPGRLTVDVSRMYTGGSDGFTKNRDNADYHFYVRTEPFTEIKNKWIQGLGLEFGAWFCNPDGKGVKTTSGTGTSVSTCQRNRVQDHGDAGRQTLYDTGTAAAGGAAGRGPRQYYIPGLGWNVGPYTLRAIMGFMNFDSSEKGATGANAVGMDNKAKNWLIAHDIFLWSPKGFLTGATTVPGSILFGQHFERNDYSTGCGFGKASCPSAVNGGEFHRSRILLREWDLWYFLVNRMSVGIAVLWYDASNLRSGRTEAQENLGVSRAGASVRGKGGDWTDVHLNWRWYF